MKTGQAFAILTITLLASSCARSSVRRVIVVYPEHWPGAEYRNCALVGSDPISKLPQLDCDTQSSDTPRTRMFVMDVEFSGKAAPESSVVYWTCQRTKESLTCRN